MPAYYRLSVDEQHYIEATILNGEFKGKDVLLPRIPMIPTDRYAFQIQTFADFGATHFRLFKRWPIIYSE